jgi:hypothetical protein
MTLALVSALAACHDKEEAEPVTQESFAASCLKHLQTSCERYTDCLAPHRPDTGKTREEQIRGCVDEALRTEGSCEQRFARSECPTEAKFAADTCEKEIREAQCSDLCPTFAMTTFCRHPCYYYCPARPPVRR